MSGQKVWLKCVISSVRDLIVHTFSSLDLKKTDWGAILDTVPAMLALTFFGILHVPINVPALGVSTKRDDIDTNRELVAHGWSNLLSGGVGSVQSMSFECTRIYSPLFILYHVNPRLTIAMFF